MKISQLEVKWAEEVMETIQRFKYSAAHLNKYLLMK